MKANKIILVAMCTLFLIGCSNATSDNWDKDTGSEAKIGIENNCSGIEYKAAVANINGDFNFKESKLNEFRSSVVNSADIDFKKLNEFIQGVYNKEMTIDMRFINKIDENSYEIIRVEGNNCYYKFVCDPYSNVVIK